MLGTAALKVLAPAMQGLDSVVNQFQQSQFSIEALVPQGVRLLETLQKQDCLSPGANVLLVNFGRDFFEYRLILAIVQSPLTFLKGVHWNSFITAIESEAQTEFKTLHQVAIAVNLAHMIAKDPTLGAEACSTLPPIMIAYILQKSMPDLGMPDKIDPSKYINANQPLEVPKPFVPPPPVFPDVDIRDLDVQQWKTILPPAAALTQFPWLKA